MTQMIKQLLTYLTALAGVAAAGLWYKASTVEHAYDPKRPETGARVEFFNGDHRWDPIRTAELQTKWNKRAALAASLAAILQAVVLAI